MFRKNKAGYYICEHVNISTMNRHFFRSIYLLFVLISALASSPSDAQQPQLSISYINLPDSIYEGQSYDTLYVLITNLGNNQFSDSLSIFIKQDTTGVDTETLYSDSAFIAGGAVITLALDTHLFDPLAYKAGGNTVVIWPVGKNATTFDTLITDFFYVKLGSAPGYERENDLLIYPNPVKDYMFLDGMILPGDVRIYTLEGRLVYDQPFKNKRIDVGDLTPGMYLVECRYRNNQRAYKKILKL